jgi:hypothetical protein
MDIIIQVKYRYSCKPGKKKSFENLGVKTGSNATINAFFLNATINAHFSNNQHTTGYSFLLNM